MTQRERERSRKPKCNRFWNLLTVSYTQAEGDRDNGGREVSGISNETVAQRWEKKSKKRKKRRNFIYMPDKMCLSGDEYKKIVIGAKMNCCQQN